MDFDETRLYYSHQQLHNTNATTAFGNNLDDDEQRAQPPIIHDTTNAANDDAQIPITAMRRHFREFFRKYILEKIT
jgi:hypothetical protein